MNLTPYDYTAYAGGIGIIVGILFFTFVGDVTAALSILAVWTLMGLVTFTEMVYRRFNNTELDLPLSYKFWIGPGFWVLEAIRQLGGRIVSHG